jgi:hypothetical protein
MASRRLPSGEIKYTRIFITSRHNFAHKLMTRLPEAELDWNGTAILIYGR